MAINCKINVTHITTIIAENTENSLNSVFNTIENTKLKIVRNSHLLSHKTGIFSSAMAIVLQTSINCSYTKNIKAAIDCSYIYCEGNHNKVLQTHAFFLQMHTLILIGVIKQINTFTQDINYINYLQNITTKT